MQYSDDAYYRLRPTLGIRPNKVRKIDGLVSLWQSVDRESVIDEIGRRAGMGGCADILLQVNTTGETTKGGCLPGEVDALRERAEAAGLRTLHDSTAAALLNGPEVWWSRLVFAAPPRS